MSAMITRKVQRKPLPCVRMRELLAIAKSEGLEFEEAWESALGQMTRERAWPHATIERKQWRLAVTASRAEMRRCYMDEPSAFGLIVAAILTHVTPDEVVADDGVVDALVLA
jgi:hypothetical protein